MVAAAEMGAAVMAAAIRAAAAAEAKEIAQTDFEKRREVLSMRIV